MTPRARAAVALGRILRGGAYSNVLLRQEDSEVGSDDRRFVQGLVMHALRTVGLADSVVTSLSKRPLSRLDPVVGDVLRIALAELDRGGTPPPVVVSEAVETAKAGGSGRAGGFVNGVLRSAVRAGLPLLSARDRLGVPPWIADRMDEAWGVEEADRFWLASSAPARVGLRGIPPPGADVTAVPGIPTTFLSDRPIPGLEIQDPASTAVALALECQPGERVIDMAAAPGGKTLVILDRMGGRGTVVAGDLHERRLRSARRRVPGATWVRLDATSLPFGESTFDRALLDAPCSGLGTLRRRPEILHRVTEEESSRLASVQRRALVEALRIVKPGGRVVYAVCTVLPIETTALVAGLGASAPRHLGLGRAEGTGWLLSPHLGPTDGMFIAVFER